MRRLRTFLICSVLVLLLVATVAFLFDWLPMPLQAPRVVQIEPANGATEILPTSSITLTFSTAMERVQTQQSILFEPHLDGDFVWRDDQTLVFTPDTRLPISTTLDITVSQSARSWLQRPLQEETVSRFTTLVRPYVVSSTPALDAQFVYVPDRVTITFSRAMDASLLADGLLVEPPLQHILYRTVERTMTIRGFFQAGTHYKITIPGFVPDIKYGIELNRDYVWSFVAASQYPNFSTLNRGRVLRLAADAPLTIPTQFTNVSRLDVALYPISREEFDIYSAAPFETWHTFQPSVLPVLTQSISTNAQLDTYLQSSITIDALNSGTYYLTVTTPEGVGDRQLVLVE
jgi:hypothetical protein